MIQRLKSRDGTDRSIDFGPGPVGGVTSGYRRAMGAVLLRDAIRPDAAEVSEKKPAPTRRGSALNYWANATPEQRAARGRAIAEGMAKRQTA